MFTTYKSVLSAVLKVYPNTWETHSGVLCKSVSTTRSISICDPTFLEEHKKFLEHVQKMKDYQCLEYYPLVSNLVHEVESKYAIHQQTKDRIRIRIDDNVWCGDANDTLLVSKEFADILRASE